MIQLYKDDDSCCGCEACVNICPVQAIKMKEGNHGFLYPAIDMQQCLECGKCLSVCKFKLKTESEKHGKSDVYASINTRQRERILSASGGAFSALARYVLDENGVVFGCAWNEYMEPHHTYISKISEISKLQGSKYVQSRIGDNYKKVKKFLEDGKTVLFSGTPCQCDGLRGFLRKEYEKLICVELICHGVPSEKFFHDYIRFLEKKIKGQIINIRFRDKKRGWGALLHIVYKNSRGQIKHKYLSTEESYYYYYYYWGGNLYRESCYSCKYANVYRKSDYTIGDYWGVQKVHPELDCDSGVSVLLVNTDKGRKLLPILEKYMRLIPSTFKDAQRENNQLAAPSIKSVMTEKLWKIYEDGGAEALATDYKKEFRKKILIGKIKKSIPLCIKKKIVTMLRASR